MIPYGSTAYCISSIRKKLIASCVELSKGVTTTLIVGFILEGCIQSGFQLNRGYIKGGPLSMFLYLLFIDDMIRDLCMANIGPMLFDMRVPCVAYADESVSDDIAVLDCSKDGLDQLLEIVYHYSKTWNFEFNSDKSALLIFGKDNQEYLRAELGQNCIKERDKYKHVGIWVTTNGTIQGELRINLQKAREGS